MILQDLIVQYRDELISRTRNKVVLRSAPRATPQEIVSGIPLFLTQLGAILGQEAAREAADGAEMGVSATLHGGELLKRGFSIAQVVHGYGDLCQAVTELALERELPIGTRDFHILNRCLDDAIASAVTEYARAREVDLSEEEVRRRGFFAHELRNHLQTALMSFQAVKSGTVGVTGSTIGVLERSLRGLSHVIDRSVSEVRIAAGMNHRERTRVADLIEEGEVHASFGAAARSLQFSVAPVDPSLHVEVDRQLFGSALDNILQNAFKFTRPASHVQLRTLHHAGRVSIEVEDECGGLPPGTAETLFQPFEQRGGNREGLGLGLTISRKAVESDGGTLTVRDIPGKGCVFVVEMPLAASGSAH
ncbi:MAG TPA: HAMP domain-containing sensor histidine kinase [Candidatus Eisenbacteria bacterium]|nr:HAMP domain-containing sensor histidine kinase [Candidatus Eisenbacteria bacterium]